MTAPARPQRLPIRRATCGDEGFTLIELLVVMVIIGVLAAIAVPVFLSQRSKARDTATKADVTSLGTELATYFVGGTGPVALDYTSTPGWVLVTDGSYAGRVKLTPGSQPPPTGASAHLDDAQQWCVALTDAGGTQKDYKYSQLDGLATGLCP